MTTPQRTRRTPRFAEKIEQRRALTLFAPLRVLCVLCGEIFSSVLPRVGLACGLSGVCFCPVSVMAAPRVWLADQGDNQGHGNRLLEIDAVNKKNPPDADGDVIILR